MRVGSDQKGKIILLALLFAGGVVAYFWGGDLGPGSAIGISGSTSGKLPDLAHLDPTLHTAELDRLRSIEYKGGDRDLFHYVAAAPPAPHIVAPPIMPGGRNGLPGTPGGPPLQPTGPPLPPPMPLQFYGMATPSNGGAVIVFLRIGETDYEVGQGETIEKRYLIQKINKLSVHVKDLQTGQEQDLPLYQG